MSNIEDEPPPVLLPCTVCSRTFRPEVLERHVKVCEKTAAKKRRVFDSFRSRVSGTELEEFFGPAPLPGQIPKRTSKSPVKKRAPSKWKETHENLIATLRAARGVEPPPEAAMEAPRPAGNERCPSCSRFFGPRAFDRHVEFCKEKTARIKLTPSKVSQAQERLEARTKYRAPLSMKPKLTTKEKYSPMLTRKDSVESCSAPSAKTSPPVPAVSRNLKPSKTNASHFTRQSPIRSSERQRSVSPAKKSSASSKPSVKSEAQVKPGHQPKIKENLRTGGDLRPKTGSKASTQEKIRRSNPKLSQLEDETEGGLKKTRKKTREKIAIKPHPLPSDNESIGTVDSELSESLDKQVRNKWSSAESLGRVKEKSRNAKRTPEEIDKVVLDLSSREKHETKAREEVKSGKQKSKQNPLINDLSVNDESFGIFVAPCSVSQTPTSASKTIVKPSRDSPKKSKRTEKEKNVPESPKMEEKILSARVDKKKKDFHKKTTTTQGISQVEEDAEEFNRQAAGKDQKLSKTEKLSKIPKPRFETTCKISSEKAIEESFRAVETPTETLSEESKQPEVQSEINEEISRQERIRQKSKKWRNITEIPTEELARISEDLDMPTTDEFQDLSESAIWDIAAEEFLQSEEPTHSTSAFSVDSLNENGDKKISGSEVSCKKSTPGGDDLIVLHVTDPAKLVENDADMKLSISEPCFPYSDKVHEPQEKTERRIVDIVVFTAFPGAIQTKITHRKRRKQKKKEKPSLPEPPYIREKTFLASDIPKPKRRKLSNKKLPSIRTSDLEKCYFGVPTKKEIDERKKKFIARLKTQREKIRKWQITATSHIRFIEEFEKSIEDDLRELKNLSEGKQIRRRPSLKEFKREKMKEMKIEQEKTKAGVKDSPRGSAESKPRKFEYFEISLEDGGNETVEGTDGHAEIAEVKGKLRNCESTHRRFECFDIANSTAKTNRRKDRNAEKMREENRRSSVEEEDEEEEETEPFCVLNTTQSATAQDSFYASDSVQTVTFQNSSLENIEEVDESGEYEESPEKKIEIEDFIVSRPDTRKILLKEGKFLDELFPKPRKRAEIKTAAAESATAVRLGFSTDSVYDLRSNNDGEETRSKAPAGLAERGNPPTRILQKRIRKESQLPQILVKNTDQKENSMMSLIEMWKNKKGSSEGEKTCKGKATLPSGKLPPLTNKNSFQIATDSNDSYDPFKQAERQMLALLSWPSTVDIKSTKSLSPSPKPKSTSPQLSNLETSPTSAFTKYPNKNDMPPAKNATNARKNLNETFAVNDAPKKISSNEKPTYNAADDWEQIFEKHFDLNRNEMFTEQMTRSVKSALDGLLKSTTRNPTPSPEQTSNELNDASIITQVLYTSTPKQTSKSDKAKPPKLRPRQNPTDLDKTPNTYRKTSNSTYGRITPPDDFCDSKVRKTNRNSGISLSSLSFCSQISDTTLADEEVMRSNLEIIGKAAAAAAAAAPRTSRRKYARSQSVFDERNKMLFAKTYDPNCSSSDENDLQTPPQGMKSPSRNPNPKSSPSHSYRSQSVVDDRCKGDGEHQHSEDGDQASSPETNRNRKGKLSGDSAYSSLNRRSRQSSQRNHHEDRLSSSGSEHSLPNVNDYELKTNSVDLDNPPASPRKEQPPVKMSKFCHECGSKYPVAVAKFCCECGVRRLII